MIINKWFSLIKLEKPSSSSQKVIGVETINYSQLSSALKELDTTFLLEIFNQLLEMVHPK